jgi:4-aminobutyrate aminotransferase
MKPKIVKKPPGPRAKEVIARDSRVISPSRLTDFPLVIEKAHGVNFEDPDGNIFLDFASGIAVSNFGHNNPKIVEAIRSQLEKAIHPAFYDFFAELPVRFSEELCRFLPKNLNTVFLANSGTEAVECAMKASRWYTRRPYFLAFHGCFHGRTFGSLSMTCSKPVQRSGFGPFLSVVHSPYAYCYRCPFGKKQENCDIDCLNFLEKTVFKTTPSNEIAACFIEPIQGEGGYIVPPKKFIIGLKKICEEHGILFVSDEVQSGCFRTGRFLAIEHFGVKPDIVTLGKAIGGELPMAVTVTSKKIMSWPEGAHANTMGGNLLACAAGLATLDLMRDKKFGEDVEKKGKYILDFLHDLQKEAKLIGDVRGKGLMIGIELIRNKDTKEPAKKERDLIIHRTLERGLVLLPCGESTIRIAPPLIISKEDIDIGLEILKNVMIYKPL